MQLRRGCTPQTTCSCLIRLLRSSESVPTTPCFAYAPCSRNTDCNAPRARCSSDERSMASLSGAPRCEPSNHRQCRESVTRALLSPTVVRILKHSMQLTHHVQPKRNSEPVLRTKFRARQHLTPETHHRGHNSGRGTTHELPRIDAIPQPTFRHPHESAPRLPGSVPASASMKSRSKQ